MDKGRKFEVIVDETLGVEVVVKVFKDMTFRAEYQGQYFKSAVAGEVVEQVKAAIKASTALEWQPVIELQYRMPEHVNWKHGQLDFEIRRYHVAPRPNGSWGEVHWDFKGDLRGVREWKYKAVPYHNQPDRFRSSFATDVSILPYTEELWADCLKLVKNINALNQKIAELVRSNPTGIVSLLPESTE